MDQILNQDEDLEATVRGLQAENEDEQYEAAFRLHTMGRPALLRALRLATDPNPLLRDWACFVLGRIENNEIPQTDSFWPTYFLDGIPVLLNLLDNDPEPTVRESAAAALGWLSRSETLPDLIRHAADASVDVRFGVTMALRHFGLTDWTTEANAPLLPKVIDTLVALSADEVADVREYAMMALRNSDYDTPIARAALRRGLSDLDADVRGEAMRTLADLGDSTVIPVIIEALKESDPSNYALEAAKSLYDSVLNPAGVAAVERWKRSHPGVEVPSQFVSPST